MPLHNGLNLWGSFSIGILLFEGITNWRIPKIVSKLRKQPVIPQQPELDTLQPIHARYRINFEAERAIRLTLAVVLMLPFIFPFGLFPGLLPVCCWRA